jgi:hypothetical protein
MAEFTRNHYEVQESFVADNGRTYLKVNWKGIDQTGYLSRIGGPGRTITGKWYKEKKREETDDEPPGRCVFKSVHYQQEYESESGSVGWGAGETQEFTADMDGRFMPPDGGPSEAEMKERLQRSIREFAEKVVWVDVPPKRDIQYQERRENNRPTGWGTFEVTITSDKAPGVYSYSIDPETGALDI